MTDESYRWQRWFAWHPVYITEGWYWLTYVARDQWANKPAQYRYARYKRSSTVRWFQFWNPWSGLTGGVIFGALLAAVVLLLASCQSREDRMWRDLQTAIEMTQPGHGNQLKP
jgi:hypothetical protein